jgi:squalene-hopene/tetraprenyl-beta-curcumene cyclase
MKSIVAWMILLVATRFVPTARAAEPITLDAVESPAEIAADEPLTQAFSLEQAARSLDTAALNWQKTHACTACHTMLPYLMARPALNAFSPQSVEVRQFFEEVVAGKREAMPAYACHDVDGAVAIGVAAALALNDRLTTGQLHPLTRQALDRMWTLQRSDGDWEWPFRDSPPLKLNEHYGVTLAAVAVGMAPGNYARTPAAEKGLEGIRRYLAKVKPVGLHQRAMTLWAAAFVDRVLSTDEPADILATLLAVQRPDGGWSLAHLVDNTDDPLLRESDRAVKIKAEPGYGTEFLAYVGRDVAYKSSMASDGYATGFAIYVSRQAGLPAADARLQRGIAWLKRNQRESGRWFTPSQAWHKQHLLSNLGTAFDVLALHACGEVPVGITAK